MIDSWSNGKLLILGEGRPVETRIGLMLKRSSSSSI